MKQLDAGVTVDVTALEEIADEAGAVLAGSQRFASFHDVFGSAVVDVNYSPLYIMVVTE